MLKYYKTVENTIVELDTMEPGCWVSAVAPTETEISSLQEELNIDRDFIRSALDEEETSRIESDDGQTLIVLDYPVAEKVQDKDDTISYYTMPMGIIITDSHVVTVCLKENIIIDEFTKGIVKGIQTQFKTRFVFHMLLRIAGKYLLYLKQIDKLSNYVEQQLHKSMKNKELIQLLGLEKSLVYFSTSLKSTETVLDKILRGRTNRSKAGDRDEQYLFKHTFGYNGRIRKRNIKQSEYCNEGAYGYYDSNVSAHYGIQLLRYECSGSAASVYLVPGSDIRNSCRHCCNIDNKK